MALREDVSERAHARVGSVLRQKWRLDTVIGIGGMASVYAATHRNGSRVAIKMLHPEVAIDQEVTARFLREGYVANAVGHPGTVRVLDDDVAEDGAPFLVMELLEGETLDARLSHGTLMSHDEAVVVADQVLDVLAAAHAKDIVHRDIKPENLFLARTGAVKVLDFGIARLRELSVSTGGGTRAGSVLGTPAYMAPEQALGHWSEVDGRTDIWAVGATLYTLLSGRSVHEGDTVQAQLVLAATRRAPPLASVVPGVSPELAAVVDRALAFERRERWPDAHGMRAALRDARAPSTGSGTLTPVHRSRAPIDQGPTLVSPSGPPQAASAASENFFAAQGVSRSASGSTRRHSPMRWVLPAVLSVAVIGAVVAWRTFGFHPTIEPATDVTQAPTTGALPPPPASIVARPEVQPATVSSGAILELKVPAPPKKSPEPLKISKGPPSKHSGKKPPGVPSSTAATNPFDKRH